MPARTSRGDADAALVRLGAALGEPARARMLVALLDGRARASTELALAAGVGPSTASVHLARLAAAGLVEVRPQGKHRYYRLRDPETARLLEALAAQGGAGPATPGEGARRPKIRTPVPLRAARSCYDHLAGRLGVALHDRLLALEWLAPAGPGYELNPAGAAALERLGAAIAAARGQRRQFATACLDWSERRPHLGGALGAALLSMALEKKLVMRQPDSRALELTPRGRRWLHDHLGLQVLGMQAEAENLISKH